jgi:orotate phosphoribosyltransferase
MNKLIIHISDLHVSDQSGTFGPANNDTYFTLNEAENINFTKHVLDKINLVSTREQERYLVITGDFSNIAEKDELTAANKIVRMIMTDLAIDKDKVLLIPGDHEIHRDSIKDALRDKLSAEAIQKIKFNNFNELYKDLKELEFPSEKLIFDHIVIDEIVLLAVNSNSIVNQTGGKGYLPTQEFEDELKHFRTQYPSQELIVCLHHNLEGEHEISAHGQWEATNKMHLVTIFERYNIKCILNGNEHTPNSKHLAGREDMIISDAGPFSCKTKPDASFKIYEIEDSGSSLSLKNRIFGLRSVKGHSEGNYGNWVEYDASEIKNTEIARFELRKEPEAVIAAPQDIIPGGQQEEVTKKISSGILEAPPVEVQEEAMEHFSITSESIVYKNDSVQNTLYGIIRDKKLFHQGHFHWSETSRAHNWIDTTRLLENKDDLLFVNKAVIDVLEHFSLIENTDLIIGLGYEGNMIASKASIKYTIPYTYLPYSYRWDDYNEFENKLHFDNEGKEYKQVILITDVVNDGRTIRKLVGKEEREKKFFDNVDRIIVVSLFYTGQEVLNYDILNYNKLSDKGKQGDEEVNNIEYYTVQQLKIEKCPYGENYKTECFILRDNLHCVHKFYTEKIQD